jgi:hypothetical protein
MLPAECNSQLILAEARPKFALGRCEFSSELDGVVFGFRVASLGAWHFAPSVLPHLHPAKNSPNKKRRDRRDENGGETISTSVVISVFKKICIPLPQIPWFSAFGEGWDGASLERLAQQRRWLILLC